MVTAEPEDMVSKQMWGPEESSESSHQTFPF
jgi:hypothetical protein